MATPRRPVEKWKLPGLAKDPEEENTAASVQNSQKLSSESHASSRKQLRHFNLSDSSVPPKASTSVRHRNTESLPSNRERASAPPPPQNTAPADYGKVKPSWSIGRLIIFTIILCIILVILAIIYFEFVKAYFLS